MARGRTVNLMDHALKMMEKYAQNFEQTIADRTRQIVEESKKSDLLLYRMLPNCVFTQNTFFIKRLGVLLIGLKAVKRWIRRCSIKRRFWVR